MGSVEFWYQHPCVTYNDLLPSTPDSATRWKGFTPLLTGFNGENGLVRSVTLFSCRATSARGLSRGVSRDCAVHLRDCDEVLLTWHPGTRGELLAADLAVSSTTVMLEIIYNSGTGWLKADSHVCKTQKYFSFNIVEIHYYEYC